MLKSIFLGLFFLLLVHAKKLSLFDAILELSEDEVLKKTNNLKIKVDWDQKGTVLLPKFFLDSRYGEVDADESFYDLDDSHEAEFYQKQKEEKSVYRKWDKNVVQMTDGTLLHVAVARSYERIVRKLIKPNRLNLEVRADVEGNSYSVLKATPLLMAVYQGNYEMVKLLIELGANVNVNSLDRLDPMLLATTAGDLEMVKLLVEEGGAELDDEERRYKIFAQGAEYSAHPTTAIHAAAFEGHVAVVDYLLRKGMDINMRAAEGKGDSVLMAAVQNNKTDVVKYLVEMGADLSVRSNDGARAVDLADMFGFNHLVEWFLEKENAGLPKRIYPDIATDRYIKTAYVHREACYTVTDCYLCRTTKDVRKKSLFSQCVWVEGDGERLPDDTSPPKAFSCQSSHYAQQHGLKVRDTCPGEEDFASRVPCHQVKSCDLCFQSIDSRPGVVSPCVWLNSTHRYKCYPYLNAMHRGMSWNQDRICRPETETPEDEEEPEIPLFEDPLASHARPTRLKIDAQGNVVEPRLVSSDPQTKSDDVDIEFRGEESESESDLGKQKQRQTDDSPVLDLDKNEHLHEDL